MLLEKDGKYSISTSFYRMMDFDAPMVGTNGGQIFQSEDGLFKDNLLMNGSTISLIVETTDDYFVDSFKSKGAIVYRRMEGADSEK